MLVSSCVVPIPVLPPFSEHRAQRRHPVSQLAAACRRHPSDANVPLAKNEQHERYLLAAGVCAVNVCARSAQRVFATFTDMIPHTSFGRRATRVSAVPRDVCSVRWPRTLTPRMNERRVATKEAGKAPAEMESRTLPMRPSQAKAPMMGTHEVATSSWCAWDGRAAGVGSWRQCACILPVVPYPTRAMAYLLQVGPNKIACRTQYATKRHVCAYIR